MLLFCFCLCFYVFFSIQSRNAKLFIPRIECGPLSLPITKCIVREKERKITLML